ncbi:hypothetical protein [Flavobacterium sp. W21_SRS_FM6]|uniref:hypothetical protein n=1 Tax=Flavobacterium sp. W21_SRS_FM6 TaxID=3240268 RepID=UPI003F91DE36
MLFILSAGILTVMLSYVQFPTADDGVAVCDCSEDVVFASELPMSHPINRCATSNVEQVSWLSWVSGRSNSYQFHFLDLLELLSRQTEAPKNKPAA